MQRQIEANVREFLGLFSATNIDFDRIEALLNPEAEYRPHPEFGPITTSKAIRGELERQLTLYNECDFQIINLTTNDSQVMMERRDYQTQNGLRVEAQVAAIFEFDKQSRIIRWREYWDLSAIQRQLGVSMEQMREYMER
ncbi:MAG: limonene-1,2-epoxide hydrolase family protein [Spongiibacteraceae bacterium]|jgi:limonene-1,2-epoxide hydrolase